MTQELLQLQRELQEFARERDWEQFHSPKNLCMALIVEAAELVEHFQWLSQSESQALEPDRKHEVAEEMADIFIYLLRLADRLDVDLLQSARDKMGRNAEKYPVDRVRGSARKYTEY